MLVATPTENATEPPQAKGSSSGVAVYGCCETSEAIVFGYSLKLSEARRCDPRSTERPIVSALDRIEAGLAKSLPRRNW